jgi:hypothetical protein
MREENAATYTVADHFRAVSDRLREKAEQAKTAGRKLECYRLADCYADLAKKHQPVGN